MPWLEVRPDRLPILSMFGYVVHHESDDFIYATYDGGEILIDKKKPILWFDEISDAMQFGVVAVYHGPG